jgi:thiamine-monophosphate kinase
VRAAGSDWLLTSDPVIEGVHFTADAPPARIGHKAVARVLSDIAAMGGTPCWALVDLVAPGDTPVERLEAIYDGLRTTADAHGLAVVGGDVAQGPVLELHLFAVGSLPRDSAVLRSGAAPGDGIYVTGRLGGSGRSGHHLAFTPRTHEGRWLREGGWVTAMCDISDGLATDLLHLAEASAAGAELTLGAVPCSDAALESDDPLRSALTDGEDFELLFTVPARRESDFAKAWQQDHTLACTRIGHITAHREVIGLQPDGTRRPLDLRGFDHFHNGDEQT